MRAYVCMYVCVCVLFKIILLCVCIHVCVCMSVWECVCVYLRLFYYVFVLYIYICVCVCVDVCVFSKIIILFWVLHVCVCVCVWVCVRAYSLRSFSACLYGQHLIDFMIENKITCLNTNFQKREGKLWTYTYANNSKAQIDYVFINRKWKNSEMNCEAYSSFEGVSSKHRIVTTKIQLSLRKNATRTATTKQG